MIHAAVRMSGSVPAVRAVGLSKSYGIGPSAVQVFSGLSLDLFGGEFVAVVGPSGCGKSTLLHLLAGIDEPDSGEVEISGVALSSLDARMRARLRNESIGFVFQFHHLLPEFSALENVSFPLRIAGLSRSEAQQRSRDVLARVGLAHRGSHLPAELSGGELQRAAVARAIVARPPLLFADEPTGNLDRENAESVFELLRSLHAESNGTVVLVTHDRELAARCDKIYTMSGDGVRSLDV
jgi:lipoprotein-releasing system ATP-binding protein